MEQEGLTLTKCLVRAVHTHRQEESLVVILGKPMVDQTTVVKIPWHSCSLLCTHHSIHKVYTFKAKGEPQLHQEDGASLNLSNVSLLNQLK